MSTWDKIMHFLGLASVGTMSALAVAGVHAPVGVTVAATALAYATGAVAAPLIKKPDGK